MRFHQDAVGQPDPMVGWDIPKLKASGHGLSFEARTQKYVFLKLEDVQKIFYKFKVQCGVYNEVQTRGLKKLGSSIQSHWIKRSLINL